MKKPLPVLKRLAPLGSLDKPSLGSLEKPALGSLDRPTLSSFDKHSLDKSSAESNVSSIEKPNAFAPKRLNSKPLLGNIDQKVLGSLDRSSVSSVDKAPSGSPVRKPRARDLINESPEHISSHNAKDEKVKVVQIGDPNKLLNSPGHSQSSSVLSGPPRNSLKIGSNRSFIKTSSVVNSVDSEVSELLPFKDGSPVRGILKSSPAKIKDDGGTDPQHVKTLRQAMIQRDEKRIMFDLAANIEFASEVSEQL